MQLTLLTPGVKSQSIRPSMNLGSNTAEEGGRPYINGNREQSNNFLLDGVDNNQASDDLLGFTPSPDAISEVNIITQNASAEFGNYNGGIVNATIKSGTNGFHGNAFEFFRNDIFNADELKIELVSRDAQPECCRRRRTALEHLFGETLMVLRSSRTGCSTYIGLPGWKTGLSYDTPAR